MTFKHVFAQRLREARELSGETQDSLAELLKGCEMKASPKTIWNWENAKTARYIHRSAESIWPAAMAVSRYK